MLGTVSKYLLESSEMPLRALRVRSAEAAAVAGPCYSCQRCVAQYILDHYVCRDTIGYMNN